MGGPRRFATSKRGGHTIMTLREMGTRVLCYVTTAFRLKKNEITGSRNYKVAAGRRDTGRGYVQPITKFRPPQNGFLKLENLRATILSAPRTGMPFAILF